MVVLTSFPGITSAVVPSNICTAMDTLSVDGVSTGFRSIAGGECFVNTICTLCLASIGMSVGMFNCLNWDICFPPLLVFSVYNC